MKKKFSEKVSGACSFTQSILMESRGDDVMEARVEKWEKVEREKLLFF